MTSKEFLAVKQTHGLNISPLYATSDNSLVLRPKDAATLQRMVEEIVWIGTREYGPIKGTVYSLFITITPFAIQFHDGDATYQPKIQVGGSCRLVGQKNTRMGFMVGSFFNATTVVDRVLATLQPSTESATEEQTSEPSPE